LRSASLGFVRKVSSASRMRRWSLGASRASFRSTLRARVTCQCGVEFIKGEGIATCHLGSTLFKRPAFASGGRHDGQAEVPPERFTHELGARAVLALCFEVELFAQRWGQGDVRGFADRGHISVWHSVSQSVKRLRAKHRRRATRAHSLGGFCTQSFGEIAPFLAVREKLRMEWSTAPLDALRRVVKRRSHVAATTREQRAARSCSRASALFASHVTRAQAEASTSMCSARARKREVESVWIFPDVYLVGVAPAAFRWASAASFCWTSPAAFRSAKNTSNGVLAAMPSSISL